MTDARFTEEAGLGFGWISAEPAWMERASHALAADGGVWVVDPVDVQGLDERIARVGEPRAVLQLLGRHGRDCAAVARRLGVPHLVVPDAVPGSPFETIRVQGIPRWRETALWWPERRALVVVEAVGTVRYYRAPGERVGVHPFLRVVRPPRGLLGFEPEHLLVGHGRSLHADVSESLARAVRRARRDLPRTTPRIVTARRG